MSETDQGERVFLGVDPALRNIGFCLMLHGAGTPLFYGVNTVGSVVIVAGAQIILGTRQVMSEIPQGRQLVICMERQFVTSGMLFYAMTCVLETLLCRGGVKVLLPFPVQVKSYAKNRGCEDANKKSQIVAWVKKQIGKQGRLSSHEADAYLMARMAQEVYAGTWAIKKPEKEIKLIPPENEGEYGTVGN